LGTARQASRLAILERGEPVQAHARERGTEREREREQDLAAADES
jgi:hypothetical protein